MCLPVLHVAISRAGRRLRLRDAWVRLERGLERGAEGEREGRSSPGGVVGVCGRALAGRTSKAWESARYVYSDWNEQVGSALLLRERRRSVRTPGPYSAAVYIHMLDAQPAPGAQVHG